MELILDILIGAVVVIGIAAYSKWWRKQKLARDLDIDVTEK